MLIAPTSLPPQCNNSPSYNKARDKSKGDTHSLQDSPPGPITLLDWERNEEEQEACMEVCLQRTTTNISTTRNNSPPHKTTCNNSHNTHITPR